ncbi:MAG: DUF5666 domain-containing protein [Candidatus Saccharicenans sp.]|nr:DUF5666 domain-containing protein [Candidatus Saccharicenans sp.]HPB60163.1 DUF5666 domain-containing protein [Candidatus Saccharicenans sp.]HQO76788.1 DUF5666 domain-containing protein [Candidatus Saccharicenans sp.]HUM80045.1 DUF5666 domain-containing protein [Candidatus Saccharicenans sp.]
MKTLTKLMVLVVSLGLIGSVAMASPNPEKIMGTVTAVDTVAKTLTVKADQSGLEYVLQVDENTIIKKGDKKISLAEIVVTDAVEVEMQDNKAISITVIEKK